MRHPKGNCYQPLTLSTTDDEPHPVAITTTGDPLAQSCTTCIAITFACCSPAASTRCGSGRRNVVWPNQVGRGDTVAGHQVCTAGNSCKIIMLLACAATPVAWELAGIQQHDLVGCALLGLSASGWRAQRALSG